MRTAVTIVLLLLFLGCSQDDPQPGPTPVRSETPAPATARRADQGGIRPGTSISIRSVASLPDGGPGSSWRFGAEQRAFDVRITLEGRATVEVLAELATTDGRILRRRRSSVEVDGVEQVDLSDFPLPEPDGYRLLVEVTGPGARARQEISIRRS